jgi:hypothetical protein
MKGVVSWVDHVQAIHLRRPILQSTKLLRQPNKTFPMDEILMDENSSFAR